jgi:hypothetical protein
MIFLSNFVISCFHFHSSQKMPHFKLLKISEIFFRISATFEMIRTESDEMCISIDQEQAAQRLLFKEKESQVGERQRERICVCASVGQNQR